jgi:hypothetical protein
MPKQPLRRKKPVFRPFYMAILTGEPLPDSVSAFEAYNVLHPHEPGLLAFGDLARPFADAWRQHHGRKMTLADVAAVEMRRGEIDAAVAATRLRQGAQSSLADTIRETSAPGGSKPYNWNPEEDEKS